MRLLWTAILIGAVAGGCASDALAAIRCVKGYQVTAKAEVATGYCQDAYLAEVAREFGMKTSAEAIRASHFAKMEVCRLIGHDIRVKEMCPVEPLIRGGRR